MARGSILSILATGLVGLAACAPSPSPAPTDAPSTGGTASAAPSIRPTPVPVSTPASTVVGITPASDRVVVWVEDWTDIGPHTPGIFLYADGSLVDARRGPPNVRVLGGDGLTWVVEQLRESGLFTSSRTIEFPPPPHGFSTYRVSLDTGSGVVAVTAANAAQDAESRALVGLAEGILAPESWLPADRWGPDGPRIHPYLARETRLTSETRTLSPGAWFNPAQSLDRISWPLQVGPAAVGQPVAIAGDDTRTIRCASITGEDEARLRTGLASMIESNDGGDPLQTGWQLFTGDGGLLRLTLRPALPHEPVLCSAEHMPPAPSLASAPRAGFAAMLQVAADGLTPRNATAGPRFWVARHSSTSEDVLKVSYYADGFVVWEDPPPPAIGFGVRRLTADGLARVDALVADARLLADDYSEVVPDGADYDWLFNVVSRDAVLNATDRGVDERATAVAEAAGRLIDPVTWLPASAWVGGPESLSPYRPGAVRLWIRHELDDATDGLQPEVLLRWPLSGTPMTFGRPDESMPDMGWRTGTVTVEQALSIVRALATAGVRPAWDSPGRAEYWLATSDQGEKLVIEMAIEAGEWGP